MFAVTGTDFCDLVTSGETDPMDKHPAADCQDPKNAAATSDPFGGNKVNVGWTLSQSSAKMKGCQGCQVVNCDTHVFLFWLFEMFFL